MVKKSNLLNSKRSIEMSFAWIFAIIAGAFILFSAIYLAIMLVKGGQQTTSVLCAKEITTLFDPMETATFSSKGSYVDFSIESRIYNSCYNENVFGEQRVSCSEKSGMVKEWPNPNSPVPLKSRYFFSENAEQGKRFYIFSMPFEMPFKVDDIIVMSSKEYCFEDAPDAVKEEVRNLGISELKTENCTGGETRVCFDYAGCNISVYGKCSGSDCDTEYDYGSVTMDGKTVYYAGNMMYAAIFSNPEIYTCNLKRLMARLGKIIELYDSEQSSLSGVGCGTASSSTLSALKQTSGSVDGLSLTGIENLRNDAEKVRIVNDDQGGCKIW